MHFTTISKSFRYVRSVLLACYFLYSAVLGYAQESTHASTTEDMQEAVQDGNGIENTTPVLLPEAAVHSEEQYRISDIHYNIKGWTRQYPLSRAVPIDKKKVFPSEAALSEYIALLKKDLHNIRTIESVEISTEYGAADNGIIPVMLTVRIKDSWNFIAVPYPSFDSNSGFKFKIKMQDFNFFGSLQPIKADLIYQSTESGHSLFSSGVHFTFPFKASPFDMSWITNFEFITAFDKHPKVVFGSGLQAGYTYKNFTVCFGATPEIVINDRSTDIQPDGQPKTPPPSGSGGGKADSGTTEPSANPMGYLYPQDRYYFHTKFYLFAPIKIAQIKNFAALHWTPYIDVSGNWAFDGIQAKQIKGWTLHWQHDLALSHIDWVGNFRKGLSFSVDNSYSYNLYKQDKIDVSFGTKATGFYPFINRVGLYGRMQLFYNLYKVQSDRAGVALRGILNKRLSTDTAIAFNFDLPIRVATLDFVEITEIPWTRVFNCDIQLVPFFDFAWVHDTKTNRYYHPADGWYSGGMEVIVFPKKMRSIYVRASVGLDLAELKNVPGLNKLKGRAKRDGAPISEIFIGIGTHY